MDASLPRRDLKGASATSTGALDQDIAIRVDNVSKTYRSRSGDIPALHNINLEISAGARVCLLGPSGSGKSTLIHICASFDNPTSGSVFLYGHPRYLSPPLRVGVVQQRDSLFPNMTAYENVAFGAHNGGATATETRQSAEHWLSRVGLHDFRFKWPRELSGGMRRRTELARALAYTPGVLLLDEPFSSLDVLTREEMQMLLLDLCVDRQLTVMFATHDIEEAIFLGERIVVLSRAPGTVAAQYDVPFPYPRPSDLRLTRDFVDLRAEITARVKQVAKTDLEV
jgi:sulfonate transport system ATP-binding protein